MSAKNLRDSILQMAVEGKLVEQRKEEGTAEDLLASIREQRAQLVREEKAKPVKGGESVIWRDDDGHWFERRGKGKAVCIDEEIPFNIPDSWCWVRMRDVLTFVNGRTYRKPELLSNGKYPVLRVGNLFTNSTWYYSNLELDDEKYCHNGDLLYAWSASFGPTIWQGGTCIFHYHIWKILHSDLLVRKYLFWYLTEDMSRAKSCTTGSAMIHISMEHMNPRFLAIPPFEEQLRIVDKIEKLMPLVGEYGKAQERREQLDRDLPIKLRKSILQAAVEGKLTEQSDDDEPASVLLAGIRERHAQLVREGKAKPVKGGDSIIYRDDAGRWFERRGKSAPICIDEEIPFDIPDTWSWARLNSLAYFSGGKTPSTADSSNYEDNGILWVTSKDMKRDHIDSTLITLSAKGAESLTLYPAGTILMVTRSGILRRMLPVAILDKEATINQDQKAIRLFDSDLAEWLFLYFKASDSRIRRNFGKSGTTVESINFNQVEMMLVAVPPLAEQRRIAFQMNAVFSELNDVL